MDVNGSNFTHAAKFTEPRLNGQDWVARAWVRRLGAVCDVSVLGERASLERAGQLVDGGEIYLPSATYSWLARDKLISVRGRLVSYSLLSQFVQEGKLTVVYLPELLDEISRRLLFEVERSIPLTDLRALLLAAHLQLPLLTFSGELVDRLNDSVGIRKLLELESPADRHSLLRALELYSDLAGEVGGYLDRRLKGGENKLIEKIMGLNLEAKMSAIASGGFGRAASGRGRLKLGYIAWDIMPVLREYLEQHIIRDEVLRYLCERTILLIASPSER